MTNPQRQSDLSSMPRAEFLRHLAKGTVFAILASGAMYALFPQPYATSLLRFQLILLTLATLSGVAFAFSTPQQRTRLRDWIVASNTALTTEQQLYLRVCVVIIAAVAITQAAPGPGDREILILSLVFIGYVAIWDCLRVYRRVSDTLLGKAVIGIGFAVASTLAYALASQQVARVVHTTPTGFTHTNLIVAIMTIPLLISLAGAFVAAIGTAMSSVIILLTAFRRLDPVHLWLFAGTWPQSTLRFAFATRLFQTAFYTALGACLLTLGRHGSAPYEQLVSRQIPRMVYELDMYDSAECTLPAGAKLAPLGDAKFLVAHKSSDGKVVFDPPIKCDN